MSIIDEIDESMSYAEEARGGNDNTETLLLSSIAHSLLAIAKALNAIVENANRRPL